MNLFRIRLNAIAMINRDQLAVCADIVNENVSAFETGKAMGLDIRKGRCRCPIHNGGDYNCSLSRTTSLFHCFSCGAKGDSIRLIRHCYGLSFVDTLRWFNDTFRLGMDIDTPTDNKRLNQAKKRLKRKADDRAFRERVEQIDFDLLLQMDAVLARLEEQRDRNRPRRYSDDWNQEFCDAVRLIPEVKQCIDYFQMQSTVKRS